MIRAAVRYADKEGPPPPELSKYLKWKTWGVLPLSGGTDDQRAGELERMLACANAFELWGAFKQGELRLNEMDADQKSYLKYIMELLNG